MHFADRLTEAVRARGNALCVGLDPRWELLPKEIRNRHGEGSLEAMACACEEFCSRVLDLVAPLVPAVKPQAAFFELCGPAGFAALQRLLRKARGLGLMTILDGKRNDIASTATAYADAAFAGAELEGKRVPVWEADALTVNPYLGRDAIEPFLESARRVQAGVFVLVRTSNPGAGLFQDLLVQPARGEEGRPLYQHVGETVQRWAREHQGKCGFGDVGAVVGATYPREMAQLRQLMPNTIFLVPGFGAQGGGVDEVRPAFAEEGLGAVVNSARGVLFPFSPEARDWEARIEQAARVAVQTIGSLSRR